jgi:hypothetical protein
MKYRIGIVGLGISILLAFFGSHYASAAPKPLRPLDAVDVLSGWIVGQDIAGYSCWNQIDKGQMPALQVKVSQKWISKVKGEVLKKSQYCTDPAYPVTVSYHWVANARGTAASSQSTSRFIKAREIIQATRTSKMVVINSFTKVLYLTVADSVVPITDAVNGFLGMLGNSSNGVGGSSSATPISPVCTFGGKFLGGRVKIVDYGADFNVKVVNFGENLNVHKVNIGMSCGEWQIVDFGQEFTIKIVSFGEDFSIKFVNFGTGLP